ncbi:hypothetical protein CERSUDRAFT_131508 [Gelatoporia subvermispora B]|uniref:Complex 1 LYR protein n=1 Tax=Ceriporiopsis subvermispora (strain B) TaxID=914234 RepID=M2R9E2_CERS8|nr:hypothetical protein CERSUDRAFT_131508 [Gelatoporia subvermispora B]
MASTVRLYRSVVRELNRSAIAPRETRNKVIASHFRKIFEDSLQGTKSDRFEKEARDAITFLRSQRVYKELLDRYNPLHDLTTEERIKATARRVGLDMPLTPEGEEDK